MVHYLIPIGTRASVGSSTQPTGASSWWISRTPCATLTSPPNDAKPSDLVPLPAPDWKPFVSPDARLRLTVRDFLVDATGFDDWPSEVNIYPSE